MWSYNERGLQALYNTSPNLWSDEAINNLQPETSRARDKEGAKLLEFEAALERTLIMMLQLPPPALRQLMASAGMHPA